MVDPISWTDFVPLLGTYRRSQELLSLLGYEIDNLDDAIFRNFPQALWIAVQHVFLSALLAIKNDVEKRPIVWVGVPLISILLANKALKELIIPSLIEECREQGIQGISLPSGAGVMLKNPNL